MDVQVVEGKLVGASEPDAGTGKAGHLHHAADEDRTLLDVLDLPPGAGATRPDIGSPWTISV